jgi:hypothetical protein
MWLILLLKSNINILRGGKKIFPDTLTMGHVYTLSFYVKSAVPSDAFEL